MSRPLRHFLDISALPTSDLRTMLDVGTTLKQNCKSANGATGYRPLEGKTLAMIFEKPSTRTRVS